MTMRTAISAIEYHLPAGELTNAELARVYPEWSMERIEEKTGIKSRRIAAPEECASDLAYEAAMRLFNSGACQPSDIDFLLLCTQSPDYFLPTTACLLQNRLGISTTAGALDFNLGCSGFVYGVALAKALIESDQARNVLLITAETYSKFLADSDRSVRTIFGDGAAATLLTGSDSPQAGVGSVVFGTDGSGGANLIVGTGGARTPSAVAGRLGTLYMAGAEIFAFTMRAVPEVVNQLLARSGYTREDVALYVFHQANRHMLENLRRKLGIASDRFYVDMEDCGNTVSATIPIALKRAVEKGRLKPSDLVMMVGFGVGYSWGAALVRWTGLHLMRASA
jgi:3-oxoacyl-[acyl-carrier-protein] synthase-3